MKVKEVVEVLLAVLAIIFFVLILVGGGMQMERQSDSVDSCTEVQVLRAAAATDASKIREVARATCQLMSKEERKVLLTSYIETGT